MPLPPEVCWKEEDDEDMVDEDLPQENFVPTKDIIKKKKGK